MEASLAHLTDNEMGFLCLFNLWLPGCLWLHSSDGSGHATLKVYRASSPTLAPPGKPGYPRLSLPLLVLWLGLSLGGKLLYNEVVNVFVTWVQSPV